MKQIRSRPALPLSRLQVALCVLFACVLFMWAFDWTWLRPQVQHYVREHSGRQIDFKALHVGLTRALEPTVSFEGLEVQNAAWASPMPLVRAGVLTFVFSWRDLRGGPVIVSRLVLLDAEVDLERQADGLRNWRLGNPEDRGPGRIRVLSLDAQRSRVRFVHRGIGLELDSRVAPLDKALATEGHPELPLTKLITFTGRYDGQDFRGEAGASDVLTFFDTTSRFALAGSMTSGLARLNLDGTAADIAEPGALEANVHLSAPSLGEFRSLAKARPLPAWGPLNLRGHLQVVHDDWMATDLNAELGRSDVSGDVKLHTDHAIGARPSIRATLRSSRIELADFGAREEPSTPAGLGPPPLSRAEFDTEPLRRADAEISLQVRELSDERLPKTLATSLSNVLATVHLREGLLALEPLQMDLAGGRASGSLRLDATGARTGIRTELTLRGIKLDRIAPALVQKGGVEGGELSGRIRLQSQGNSLQTLVAEASGSASAALNDATVSDKLDAKLALDGIRLVSSLLEPQERMPLDCASLSAELSKGNGTARLALQTGRTFVSGRGAFDLGKESMDIILTPHRQAPALLSLDRSVRVSGTFGFFKTALVARDESPAAARCKPLASEASAADPKSKE